VITCVQGRALSRIWPRASVESQSEATRASCRFAASSTADAHLRWVCFASASRLHGQANSQGDVKACSALIAPLSRAGLYPYSLTTPDEAPDLSLSPTNTQAKF
jgi:hypothetical protein